VVRLMPRIGHRKACTSARYAAAFADKEVRLRGVVGAEELLGAGRRQRLAHGEVLAAALVALAKGLI